MHEYQESNAKMHQDVLEDKHIKELADKNNNLIAK